MRFQDRRTKGSTIPVEPYQNFAGHRMFCEKCRTFRTQHFAMVGNGAPFLEMRCYMCGNVVTYVPRVGGWIPISVVRSLENFADARIDRQIAEMEARIKRAEKVTTESSESVPVLNVSAKTFFTRFERLKSWVSCRRYLGIAAPFITLKSLLVALGVLAYNGIHVEPFASIAAQFWKPWMNGEHWIVIDAGIAVALLAGYVRCRLANRKPDSEIEKPIIYTDEHDEGYVLHEMERF